MALGNEFLTNSEDEIVRNRQTYPGMATWGGTGPVGRICRSCVHFLRKDSDIPNISALCGKYKELMGPAAKKGALVPYNAPACRYFEGAPLRDRRF